MSEDRLTALESALAHAERTVEELSDVVREQATRTERLERQIGALAARLGAAEERAESAAPADQRPPHW